MAVMILAAKNPTQMNPQNNMTKCLLILSTLPFR